MRIPYGESAATRRLPGLLGHRVLDGDLVVLLGRDLVEDVADHRPRDRPHDPLPDLLDRLADVRDRGSPAFFGSIRHMTLTSMWTLFPSFVLNVMSSGIGRSPSFGLAFIRRFCWATERVVQELTTGRTM